MSLKTEALEELKELQQQHGTIIAAAVVEKARSADSALHGYFTWDKTEAAERYLIHQARMLIHTYKVQVKISGSDIPVSVRALVHLSTEKGYRTLSSVLEDNDRHEVMLHDALHELKSFQKKYAALSELEAVFMEIQKVVERPRLQEESRV